MSKRFKEIVRTDEVIAESPKGKRNTFGEIKLEIVQDVFFKVTASKRKEVRDWLMKQKPESERNLKEYIFLKNLANALEEVNYDYEIATMEPAVIDGKIAYIKGKDVALGYDFYQWTYMAEEYLPERGSRLATVYELLIWYAWRIVKGYWTLDYVVNDSSSAGNYYNSSNSAHEMEKIGARKIGGFRDGQGNICKLVTYKRSFAIVGGAYGECGYDYPVSHIDRKNYFMVVCGACCGVVVLTKATA